MVLLLFFYSCSDDSAGTATDVNSGSLSGTLEHDGTPYQENIDLYLRETKSGNIVDHQLVTDGNYSFEAITFGTYDLVASIEDNSVTLGYEEKVYIEKGYTADIAINRIAKKSFQLATAKREELTLDRPQISNIYANVLDKNTIQLTFAEHKDTLELPLSYTLNNQKDSLTLRMVRELNQSYRVEFTKEHNNLQLFNLETTLLTGDGSDSSTIIIDGIIE